MKKSMLAVALALGLGVVVAPAAARADVTCSIVEIEASSGSAPSIDPELKALERKFKRPPLSSWNVFKKLGTTQLGLDLQKSASAALVHGKINLHVRDVIERPGKRARLQLGIALDDGNGQAGDRHQGQRRRRRLLRRGPTAARRQGPPGGRDLHQAVAHRTAGRGSPRAPAAPVVYM
jgi:hypothetical protein